MLLHGSRHVAVVLALAGALFGVTDVVDAKVKGPHRRFDSAPVKVTSPLATDTLNAGETIVIAWEPLAELERHAGFEEWEAFLSLDDGERYPVRLTPHLDLAQRTFAVTLPQFAARRARLLLRFGDEREEFEYEVPGELEISAARQLEAAPMQLARGRGEAARPEKLNDPGVTIWVEGRRDGSGTRTVAAARRETEIEALAPRRWIAFRHATAAPASPQVAAADLTTHPSTGLFASSTTAPGAAPRGASIEPRRRTCRQNE